MSQRCPENNTPIAEPGSRVRSISTSDIDKYTTEYRIQLDERRKAEILKYKKNATNITRNAGLARILRGAGRFRVAGHAIQNQEITDPNVQNLPLIGTSLICNSTPNNCGSTDGANVPGKIMKLCLNTEVPLTRFRVRRTYN